MAASLELKAEKPSAHSGTIWSVGFSPDGKTIVSGSFDQALKVWDAGAPIPAPDPSLSPNLSVPHTCRSIPGAQGGEAERAQ